jgi:hypothetical protein
MTIRVFATAVIHEAMLLFGVNVGSAAVSAGRINHDVDRVAAVA